MKFISGITTLLRKAKNISKIILLITAIVETATFLADKLEAINDEKPKQIENDKV